MEGGGGVLSGCTLWPWRWLSMAGINTSQLSSDLVTTRKPTQLCMVEVNIRSADTVLPEGIDIRKRWQRYSRPTAKPKILVIPVPTVAPWHQSHAITYIRRQDGHKSLSGQPSRKHCIRFSTTSPHSRSQQQTSNAVKPQSLIYPIPKTHNATTPHRHTPYLRIQRK